MKSGNARANHLKNLGLYTALKLAVKMSAIWAVLLQNGMNHLQYNHLQYNNLQYNNSFAFPFEIRLQEIYIYIFFFYDKMLNNFEICI